MLQRKWIMIASLLSVAAGWLYQMSSSAICFEKLGFIYLGNILFWILLVNPIQNLQKQELFNSSWIVANLFLSLFFVAFNQIAVNLFVQSVFLVCFDCVAGGTIFDMLQTNHFLPNLLIYWLIISHQRFYPSDLEKTHEQSNESSYVIVKQGGSVIKLQRSEIYWIGADDNAVNIHTESRKFVQYGRLRDWEERLSADAFVRVHRSFLVNARHIRSFQPKSNGDGILTLSNLINIRVSRNYKHNLRASAYFSISS